MTDLAKTLTDAAAAADWQAHHAGVLTAIGQKGSLDEKRRRISEARSRAAVVAVLETLAEQGQSSDPDVPPQLRLAVPAMQRLAAEVRGVGEKGTDQ